MVVGCFGLPMGGGNFPFKTVATERVIAVRLKATSPTTVIGLVNGLEFKEPLRTKWTLIVGNA